MNHILFLSSDPVLRQKNIETLTQSGLETSGVADCLDGLLIIDKDHIDLAVIDEELHDVSGYEACLKVRQRTDIPIILLGSVTESEVWADVEDLGFDLYLRKPISPRELIARIKALLRRPAPEKKDKVAVKPKIAESGSAMARSAVVKPEPARPAENFQKKPEPVIALKATEPPIQAVSPVKSASPRVRTAPPQPDIVPPQPRVISQERVSRQQQYQAAAPSKEVMQPKIEVPARPVDVRFTEPVTRPPMPETVKAAPSREQAPATPQREQVVLSPTNEQVNAPKISQESSTGGVVNEEALEDVRILRLVDALVSGKLTEITPVIDLSLKLGYNYPTVDSLIDTTDEDTVNVLENLAKNEILIKKPFEKLYIDPDNSMQLVPIERCPRCDSSNLVKGQLVEHFYCGYVGLDREFKQDSRYDCPKCHRELRLIGTDYRNIGIHYRCLDCNEIFATPVVKWRNLKTRQIGLQKS